MASKAVCIGLLILASAINLKWHEFYVSVSHISQEESSGKLLWTCRVFKDDFEKAIINISSKDPGWIYNAHDSLDRKTLVDYFASHMALTVNGDMKKLELLDCQVEGEGPTTTISCDFITLEAMQDIKMIRVDCSLLTDTLDDQVNMIHVKVDGTRRSKNLNIHRQSMEVILE